MSAPVVLLHALAADEGMWAGQERALAESGHPVLAPNLYRLADRVPGPPSVAGLAAALADVLDASGFRRVVLAGCSLGGYVAMALVRHRPGLVGALALLGTRADADDPATRAQRLAFANRIADPASARVLTAATAPKLLGAGTRRRRPELLRHVEDVAHAVRAGDVAWVQRAVADREAAHDVLAGFASPAVVLVGAEDELVSADDARRAAGSLPHGRLRIVPDAGHLLPLEAPDAIRHTLESLLADVEREPAC
ncbi:alpha/beta fold hydrolase [Saccharothrix isguenensis]